MVRYSTMGIHCLFEGHSKTVCNKYMLYLRFYAPDKRLALDAMYCTGLRETRQILSLGYILGVHIFIYITDKHLILEILYYTYMILYLNVSKGGNNQKLIVF